MKASDIPPLRAHFSFSTVNYAQRGFYCRIVCDFIVFPQTYPRWFRLYSKEA